MATTLDPSWNLYSVQFGFCSTSCWLKKLGFESRHCHMTAIWIYLSSGPFGPCLIVVRSLSDWVILIKRGFYQGRTFLHKFQSAHFFQSLKSPLHLWPLAYRKPHGSHWRNQRNLKTAFFKIVQKATDWWKIHRRASSCIPSGGENASKLGQNAWLTVKGPQTCPTQSGCTHSYGHTQTHTHTCN